MSNATRKIKFAMLNLMAPGVGQLAMGRWVRGTAYLILALACTAWVVFSFFRLLIGNIHTAAEGGTPTVDIFSIFFPMGLLMAVWIVSCVDLSLAKLKPLSEQNDKWRKQNADKSLDREIVRCEIARQLKELKDSGKIILVDEEE